MRILICGVSGLIGSAIYSTLSKNNSFNVRGTIRNADDFRLWNGNLSNNLYHVNDISSSKKWAAIFLRFKPNIVINCIGLTKHVLCGNNPLNLIPINSYFPHFIASLCMEHNAKFIQISSDCVFSGKVGMYVETDIPDSKDYYGRSKALGEVVEGNSITIRTSTVGHEIKGMAHGLLDWFLNQKKICNGYTEAFFSGITTIELAKIIEDLVIPNDSLCGLYHVGSERISKFDLLNYISKYYDKKIKIVPNSVLKVDRSLNSNRFIQATGYRPKSWEHMIREVRSEMKCIKIKY